ncbi:uncharacterized protein LOC107481511 [Arachis duranensis]|uniref:Uncharacterized protein LOC107481511 n=1 Tax=Arachis duranensis TaxID=130453 RepID=A0A6P4CW76_ARADU|nr:uncharacterized protein LOC107481511 [Arachis duranensis]
MFDSYIRSLQGVRHVKGLKKNLLSTRQLDKLGCKTHIEGGILKVVKGALVVIKAEKIVANLYMFIGDTLQEAEASVASASQEKMTMIWRLWVYPIKKKSDVFAMFKGFKVKLELKSGKKIKCLRIDNGGEYIDGDFLTFCKQAGIQPQFTVTYTPQQNGVA